MTAFKIESNFAYGLTKPGAVPYSSENFRASITVTEDIEAETLEGAIAIAAQRNAQIAQEVKTQAINEAGLVAKTDANGVLSPVFGAGLQVQSAAPVAAPAVVTVIPADEAPFDPADLPANTVVAQPVAGISTGQPSAAPSGGAVSKVETTVDGRPATIYDNRGKKVAPGVTPNKANGEHAANAADFSIKWGDVGDQAPNDVKYKSVWIKNRDQSVNQLGLNVAQLFGG